MLPNLIDYPVQKIKHHAPLAGTHKKVSAPISSWDFEIQEPEVQETYNSHAHTLNYNDLNAYVVDWEMPK